MATSTFNRKVKTHGRSGLEDKTMADLEGRGIPFLYEAAKVAYIKPETAHTYTPDFILPNGIIVETKGLWEIEDRKKHLLIREQHPGLDIRLVFSRSKSPLRKGAKTTYGSFCEKHGIPYADKVIPQEWVDEPNEPERHAALEAAKP
jgi:hypothetical protein